MSAAQYTALIRWQGPDATIQIETRHPGFRTPEDAAVFANGLSPNAPQGLRLWPPNTLQLFLNDYDYVHWHSADVILWFRTPGCGCATSHDPLSAPMNFEPQPFEGFAFPASAFGDYRRIQFAVHDQNACRVDLALDWTYQNRGRVIVYQTAASDESAPAFFFIGPLPKA